MKWQTERGCGYHQTISQTKFPDFDSKELPYFYVEGISSIFNIPQHCCNSHYCECNPEQDIKALEVPIITIRIEM